MHDFSEDSSKPVKPLYGYVFRERGTKRIVLFVLAIILAWYAWGAIHNAVLNSKNWPLLSPIPNGLTVLSLQDRDRPGWKARYRAIESNHSWQVRRPDDAPEQETDIESSDSKERGSMPGDTHKVTRGQSVSVQELYKTCPTILTGIHFVGAGVEERLDPFADRTYYVVNLQLSDEGRSRYWQFARNHEKDHLAFILNGQIVTCPKVNAMYVSSFSIDPIWIKADAEALARAINTKKYN